ncbi:MAG: UDP-2,4-diacetamido-2,4,6-trideoxy-beta-L-altropyranose hydrolase [Bacteroidia bacterium]|nr:UDP-2,4-diacetamido-2,4,6-trideoxy-beta-L-altropyranose hydrolase [Bacteroidia bacterium]
MNIKPQIFFRADGSPTLGLGHLMRCYSLFEIISDQFKCSLITKTIPEVLAFQFNQLNTIKITESIDEDEEIKQFSSIMRKDDIVVLDGYQFTTSYQKKLKKLEVKVICIDDIHAFHFCADAVINHAPGIKPTSYSIEPYTKLFLGLEYAILRKDFYIGVKSREINIFNTFLISMGGADVENNSLKIARQLIMAIPNAKINIIVGAANMHIETINTFIKNNGLFKQISISVNLSANEIINMIEVSHLMICPASTTLYEACAIGIPVISGKTADNQTDILTGFDNAAAILNIGDFNAISEVELYNLFLNIESMKPLFQQHYSNQKKLINKRAPEQILNIFRSI